MMINSLLTPCELIKKINALCKQFLERSKNDINKTACYTYVEKNVKKLLEEENLETKLKLAFQI